MMLDQWAARWGVPPEAVAELRGHMGVQDFAPAEGHYKSEAFVQSTARLEASKLGARLWRNNVGAGKINGRSFIRWGLANESEKMNDVIKSSDLIGWTPVVVTPEMVGQRLAVFTSIETKAAGWRYRGDEHEAAQLAWIQAVVSAGGLAGFVCGAGQVASVLTAAVNKP